MPSEKAPRAVRPRHHLTSVETHEARPGRRISHVRQVKHRFFEMRGLGLRCCR